MCLNEQGWHPDLIELQLARAERNKIPAAYNWASRLPERRRMMQAWADYLAGLRAGANVPSAQATGLMSPDASDSSIGPRLLAFVHPPDKMGCSTDFALEPEGARKFACQLV